MLPTSPPVILMILLTTAPEQRHSLFQKSLVHIYAKSPCWTVPLSLCSVPLYFPRPLSCRSRIGYLLPVRNQRLQSVPEIHPAWGPTVIPTSRPSTAPTHNPPPTSTCGPRETPITGPTVHYPCVFRPAISRFLIAPPSYPFPPPSLSYIFIFILLSPVLPLLGLRSDQGGVVTVPVGRQGVPLPTNHAFSGVSAYPISIMP